MTFDVIISFFFILLLVLVPLLAVADDWLRSPVDEPMRLHHDCLQGLEEGRLLLQGQRLLVLSAFTLICCFWLIYQCLLLKKLKELENEDFAE